MNNESGEENRLINQFINDKYNDLDIVDKGNNFKVLKYKDKDEDDKVF